MVADTTAELLAMADKIGLHKKWLQAAGTYHEHFDVCLSFKKKALSFGAKEITLRQLAEITNAKRKKIGAV